MKKKTIGKEYIFTALILFVVLAVTMVLDSQLPSYHIVIKVIKKASVYSLVAVSMNLLNGFTGLFSLGQAGFMLLGAYSYAVLCIPVAKRAGVYQYFDGGIVKFSLPEIFASFLGDKVGSAVGMILALLVGGLIAAFFAYLIGLPVLRLKSDYLAIATLGFAEIMRTIIQWNAIGPLTNASNLLKGYPDFSSATAYLLLIGVFIACVGLPQPVKTPIPWISDTVTLFGASTKRVTVVTPVLTIALVFALVALIKKTKIGMGMRAAAKDFETAQLMGVKINSVISMTFVIGSFLAAVGAMLYFTNYPTVAITSGGMPGLKAFVAAVFGGIGSIPGAVVGAFLIGLCEEIIKGLGQSTFSDAFTFALLIIVLCVKPTGLFGEKVTDKV